MARLTISTTRANRVGNECHDFEDVDYSRFSGNPSTDREVVNVFLSTEQALAIAFDLLYQAVDAGALAGWNVQLPARGHAVA